MADPPRIFLLVSDADNDVEFSTNVSALLMCLKWSAPTVASSLAKSAVEVMVTARQSTEFQCSFDSVWDPLKSQTSIADNFILGNEELQSYSEALNISLRGADLSNYSIETDETCQLRFQQALFEEYEGSLMVVAPAASIQVCLKLLGEPQDQCPVLTVWNIYQAQKQATNAWKCLTLGDLRAYLIDNKLLQDIKMPGPEVFAKKPSPEKVSVNIPQPENRPPPRDEEFLRLSEELHRPLKDLLINQIPPRADPLESILLNVTSAVGKLYDRFNEEAGRWNKDRAESEQFKIEKTKQIENLQRQFEESRRQQEADLIRVTESFDSTKKELELRCNELEQQVKDLRKEVKETADIAKKLRDQEVLRPKDIPAENPPGKPPEIPRIPQQPPQKHEPRAEEAKAIVAEPVPEGPLVQILSLGRNADGKLTATVMNRGVEEIWGYLCVAQQGEFKAYPPQPLSFVGKSEIDMSSWAQLPPGQYEASVLNNVTNECVSNSFPFPVAEEQINQPQPPQSEDANFEQCFVNQNVTNMAEVQEYVLTNYGEIGFQNFKKIACQWKNPSHDQLNPFLQTIAGTNLQDEAAARQQLEASGFLL